MPRPKLKWSFETEKTRSSGPIPKIPCPTSSAIAPTVSSIDTVGRFGKRDGRYAATETKFEFVKVSNTTFHVPDIFGAGVSWSPIPVLKVNADAVHITYSNLVDQFVSINEDIRAIDKAPHRFHARHSQLPRRSACAATLGR